MVSGQRARTRGSIVPLTMLSAPRKPWSRGKLSTPRSTARDRAAVRGIQWTPSSGAERSSQPHTDVASTAVEVWKTCRTLARVWNNPTGIGNYQSASFRIDKAAATRNERRGGIRIHGRVKKQFLAVEAEGCESSALLLFGQHGYGHDN